VGLHHDGPLRPDAPRKEIRRAVRRVTTPHLRFLIFRYPPRPRRLADSEANLWVVLCPPG
jgi:hypothetical protein